jgi:hypothetical protein
LFDRGTITEPKTMKTRNLIAPALLASALALGACADYFAD